MAAGDGTNVRWKFDSKTFWRDLSPLRPGSQLTTRINSTIFSRIPSAWSGRADVESIPNGVRFLTGPDQSTMTGTNVTVTPDGDFQFVEDDTNAAYLPRRLQGKRSPWVDEAMIDAIFDVVDDYMVVDTEGTAKSRARELRGLAEASKGFEFGTRGKNLPDRALANIASFVTGKKETAGTPAEQMRQIRQQVAPNYAEKLEEKRTQETLAAMKGGRKKTQRSQKKRLTRRR